MQKVKILKAFRQFVGGEEIEVNLDMQSNRELFDRAVADGMAEYVDEFPQPEPAPEPVKPVKKSK